MFGEKQDRIFKVVLNHEEQYSIWPVERENPQGWRDAGKSGPKQECLDFIRDEWTDMRPLSLRQKMESAVENGGVPPSRKESSPNLVEINGAPDVSRGPCSIREVLRQSSSEVN